MRVKVRPALKLGLYYSFCLVATTIGFTNSYLVDSDLSTTQRHPVFEQLTNTQMGARPSVINTVNVLCKNMSLSMYE